MKLRTALGLFALKCQWVIELCLPLFMDRESCVEFNRRHFSFHADEWKNAINEGFFDSEQKLMDNCGFKPGRALCLGSGGGRESFVLARRGFRVLGVDQVAELVRFAQDTARKNNLEAEFVQGELSTLDLDGQLFDYIFMLNINYSYIPSRRARLELLRKCRRMLLPGGRMVVSFAVIATSPRRMRWSWFLRLVSRLSGNPDWEPGNTIYGSCHFIHYFHSPEGAEAEAREAGFRQVKTEFMEQHYMILTP